MNYRIDIQALRGLAVLLVVFYHAGLGGVTGGYLGVDVFFVISGFLITNQIAKMMLNDSFTFKAFYVRRAWRLLPAVYSVLIACCIAAPFLLSNEELHDFTYQVIGTTTFSANVALWLQTGYFETASELKPLLHMWSLSIEEQYYLALPALLFISSKKHWKLIVITLTLLSFLLMMLMNSRAPGAVFYLTPTRVWELGIGSVLALYLLHRDARTPQLFGYIALILIIALSIKPIDNTQFTVMNNLIVTLATGVLISSHLNLLNCRIAFRTLAQVGTVSYSLYLVHWPIMAFLNSANIKVSGPSVTLRLLAIFLSFILAIGLYIWVEKKWRITHNNEIQQKRSLLALLLIPVMIVLAAWSIEQYRGSTNTLASRTHNVGLDKQCKNESSLFSDLCKTSSAPEMLIWGDSYAMHLVPALQTSPIANFQQATRSTCSPSLKTAHFDAKKHNTAAGIDCLKFNQSVLSYIRQSSTIKTVVLASPWHYLLHDKPFLTRVGNEFELRYKEKSIITNELIDLITKLRSDGKKVVLVSPPPATGFNSRKCHERNALNLIKIGGVDNCELRVSDVVKHQEKVKILVNKLNKKGIATYDFTSKLCDKKTCRSTLNGAILYNDGGHLSVNGSRAYGKQYNLYEELLLLAN